MSMEEIAILKRRLEREKQARKQAETILEKKALELFHLNAELEVKIARRTKELRISEEKYRGLIENMELGLLEVDTEQKIIRAYDWFCDMTGYSKEELLGQNAIEFLLADRSDLDLVTGENINRSKGQRGVYELQIKHKEGHCIWVIVSGSPVVDINGKVVGSLGIHYDITQRKKLEVDLLQAKKTAEKAQQAEQQFLAHMSHEIRTPLNAIIGMSHLLADSNPTPDQHEYLKILSQSSNILKLLITDILDFTKIEAGKVEVRDREFDVWQLIDNLYKTTQLRVDDKAIQVSYEIDSSINYYLIGDDLLLNQILINLLGNASKFTKEGEIGIIVRKTDESKEMVSLEFKVYDTGIGIPQDQQKLIFQNFKQIEDHKSRNKIPKKFDGTGLGLAITKQLVELQGGYIQVQSQVNERTEFTFYLTYKKSREIQLRSQGDIGKLSTPSFTDAQLLVVEDNYMNQRYIAALLNKWKLEFEFANDGAMALELAYDKKYDIIFMDISMPIMNGYDATQALREVPNPNQKTPIIALSALAFKKEKDKALNIGMTDFLGKPFTPDGLLSILRTYIEEIPQEETTRSNNKGFNILPDIFDKEYLESIYLDDFEYALEMFQIFTEHSFLLFANLEEIIKNDNFETIRQKAHQLKPNFSMVGLTELRDKMEKLEHSAEKKESRVALKEQYIIVQSQVEKAKPFIHEALLQLEEMLSQYK